MRKRRVSVREKIEKENIMTNSGILFVLIYLLNRKSFGRQNNTFGITFGWIKQKNMMKWSHHSLHTHMVTVCNVHLFRCGFFVLINAIYCFAAFVCRNISFSVIDVALWLLFSFLVLDLTAPIFDSCFVIDFFCFY